MSACSVGALQYQGNFVYYIYMLFRGTDSGRHTDVTMAVRATAMGRRRASEACRVIGPAIRLSISNLKRPGLGGECGGGEIYDAEYSTDAKRFFFSSRRRHTRFDCDWSSDVCSSD